MATVTLYDITASGKEIVEWDYFVNSLSEARAHLERDVDKTCEQHFGDLMLSHWDAMENPDGFGFQLNDGAGKTRVIYQP